MAGFRAGLNQDSSRTKKTNNHFYVNTRTERSSGEMEDDNLCSRDQLYVTAPTLSRAGSGPETDKSTNKTRDTFSGSPHDKHRRGN